MCRRKIPIFRKGILRTSVVAHCSHYFLVVVVVALSLDRSRSPVRLVVVSNDNKKKTSIIIIIILIIILQQGLCRYSLFFSTLFLPFLCIEKDTSDLDTSSP
jgi:hypothetical protein